MSPRPGWIIDVVPVDLPRPRDVLMPDTPAFTALASRIRRRLWEEEPDA
jgi:NitT/TauT family transport system ATP-binding protein